jgi:hypothetical protein
MDFVIVMFRITNDVEVEVSQSRKISYPEKTLGGRNSCY